MTWFETLTNRMKKDNYIGTITPEEASELPDEEVAFFVLHPNLRRKYGDELIKQECELARCRKGAKYYCCIFQDRLHE